MPADAAGAGNNDDIDGDRKPVSHLSGMPRIAPRVRIERASIQLKPRAART